MTSQISHSDDSDMEPTCRVLLADDSLESQTLIQRYLQETHYQVKVVSDGEEAVAAFQSTPFDIVLIDQQMPVMDGFTATRLIRAWESSHQHSPAPILALTADSFDGAKEQSQAAGCTGFLAKPISRRQLFNALRTYCAISPTTRATTQDRHSPAVAALIDKEITRGRPLFLDNRRKDLSRMRDAVAQGDYETVRTMGHRMKGLAGSYGFPDIGMAGARLEQVAQDHDLASIRQAIDQLAEILARTSQAA